MTNRNTWFACLVWAAGLAPAEAFDLQAHRGGRGLWPENTLAAFRNAQAMGVTTLETDLAITKDDIVVISHDPRLNADLTRGPDGKWLGATGPTIRSLTRADLAHYDIGRLNPESKYGQQFATQKPIDGEQFPTLGEFYAQASPGVRFNIETKIDPRKPDDTLEPRRFTQLVIDQVRAAKMERRTTLQSFDWRTLTEARRLAPGIETACLSIDSGGMNTVAAQATGQPSLWLGGLDPAAHGGSIARLAKAAGCGTWSPFWRNVTAANVAEAQGLGLKVVPWTVNNPADMAALIDLKVDGLITDYPDRGLAVLKEKGLKPR